ncbi:MAG TPA: RNase adapter RapZ [Candidatus Tectomicrobia bacterium]|nr:RNase adapter RapZ [Candidatus Tectomicrobia bacterium]
MRDRQIVIVTGLSGSGKSVAIKCFEDLGFYCIDNLPTALLPTFAELSAQAGDIRRIALGIDMRDRDFPSAFPTQIDALRQAGFTCEILFLEARDEVLTRRYSETRRKHPLAEQVPVPQAITLEREALAGLRDMADRIIDTSDYNVHQLRTALAAWYATANHRRRMTISVLSFGYKYGLPFNADLVFDVRFLPNPHFVDHLRAGSGHEPPVAEYILASQVTQDFIKRCFDFVDFLLPHYEREGKAYLTVALGCTGGRHRSVAIANLLHQHLEGQGYQVMLTHRDLEKS